MAAEVSVRLYVEDFDVDNEQHYEDLEAALAQLGDVMWLDAEEA